MVEKAEILKHHADTATQGREVVAPGRTDILAEHFDFAARRPLREVHQLQKGGLARARWPGQEMERSRR